MCEVLTRIEEKGILKGELIGRAKLLLSLVKDNEMDPEKAAEKLGLSSADEFFAKCKELGITTE